MTSSLSKLFLIFFPPHGNYHYRILFVDWLWVQYISETELHSYGGGPVETEARDSSAPDPKQGVIPSKTSADSVVPSLTSVPHPDSYHIGVPSQRLSNVLQKTGPRIHQKWKGPDKISKIYGDWIDVMILDRFSSCSYQENNLVGVVSKRTFNTKIRRISPSALMYCLYLCCIRNLGYCLVKF